jgi:LAO/AO transport system kinase
MTSPSIDPARLAEMLRSGDRAALARAITLVESSRSDDRSRARTLLEAVQSGTGGALRVGVSGAPGVGKSSLLEALGAQLCDRGKHVAVLAIDPSSSRSGGSILGDKTRMERLSRHERAFVRPTAGGTSSGGVAASTREAMLLCEAAGFDVVFVETIGVGQSEHAVADLVDFLLLLCISGAGDELQGIKRGILELADGVAFTKADGENIARARLAASELRDALHILRADAMPFVTTCSARSGDGVAELWLAIDAAIRGARADGSLAARRSRQDRAWFDRALEQALIERMLADPAMRQRVAELRSAVSEGRQSPTLAARRALDGVELRLT